MSKYGMFGVKGGPGKTTVTLVLYEALRFVGTKVKPQDWDVQGTLTQALNEIYQGKPPTESEEECDVTVYDTPGIGDVTKYLEHPATRFAAINADVALLLTTPSPPDLWTVMRTIQGILQINPNLKPFLIINKYRSTTKSSLNIDKRIKKNQITVPRLAPMLSYRECYQHVMEEGWKAFDTKAQKEVIQLALAIMAIKV